MLCRSRGCNCECDCGPGDGCGSGRTCVWSSVCLGLLGALLIVLNCCASHKGIWDIWIFMGPLDPKDCDGFGSMAMCIVRGEWRPAHKTCCVALLESLVAMNGFSSFCSRQASFSTTNSSACGYVLFPIESSHLPFPTIWKIDCQACFNAGSSSMTIRQKYQGRGW